MGIDNTQYFCDGNCEWDVKELWEAAKDLPVNEIPIEIIGLSTVSDDFEDNIKRVESCDLTYPIILTPAGYVADGMRRLIKTILMGKEKILVKQFKSMPEPTHIIVERSKVY